MSAIDLSLLKPLVLPNEDQLSYYSHLIHTLNESHINEIEKQNTIDLLKLTLESKQCNEPYEVLLSKALGVVNNPGKHGFDGTSEDKMQEYEYKPTKNKTGGTINDDTICKIEKCEQLIADGKQGWLVLAFINTTTYSFDAIYKFHLEIYNEDRRKYVMSNMAKNQTKDKQTRSTYSISLSKSIKLTKEFNKPYYVWKSK